MARVNCLVNNNKCRDTQVRQIYAIKTETRKQHKFFLNMIHVSVSMMMTANNVVGSLCFTSEIACLDTKLIE